MRTKIAIIIRSFPFIFSNSLPFVKKTYNKVKNKIIWIVKSGDPKYAKKTYMDGLIRFE